MVSLFLPRVITGLLLCVSSAMLSGETAVAFQHVRQSTEETLQEP